MRLVDLRHLSGPNVFTARPVSLARIELDELAGVETTTAPASPGGWRLCCPAWPSTTVRPGGPAGSWTRWPAEPISATSPSTWHWNYPGWPAATCIWGARYGPAPDGSYDIMMECPQDEPADSPVPAELIRAAIAAVGDVLSLRADDVQGLTWPGSPPWRAPKAWA